VELMSEASWTSRDKSYVRRSYGKRPTREIAAKLGRTVSGIRCLAKRLGVRTRELFTAAELAFIREASGKLAVPEIARKLGRSQSSVHQRRAKMGLSCRRVPMVGFVSFLRQQHAAGWSDAEIASAWSARFPDRRTLERHTVGQYRERLGLPHNAYSDHRRRRVAERTQQQLAAAGLPSIGWLRKEAFRKRAIAAGWPGDLRPRAVQILNALWDRGPMTRPEIAKAIGMPWKGSRQSLTSNDPEGSYLAHLQSRGLVIVFKRACKVLGKGKGHSMDVYSLPLDIERKSA
jgi:hypothetical protein